MVNKRLILQDAEQTEFTLDGYTAAYSAGKDKVVVYDVSTYDQIVLTYAQFERGILVNDGNFKSEDYPCAD